MQYKRKDSILSMVEVPDCITAEYYDSVDMFTVASIWQLSYRDISNHKIEISTEEELSGLCFNTETVFPKNLQELADKVLEKGKSHRLNTCGLTGKGIKVAVIDRPFNSDHVEFAGRVEYIEVYPGHPHYEDPEFHGTVCAGFLSGATCGVAPESELVYFVIPCVLCRRPEEHLRALIPKRNTFTGARPSRKAGPSRRWQVLMRVLCRLIRIYDMRSLSVRANNAKGKTALSFLI